MDLFNPILECLCTGRSDHYHALVEEEQHAQAALHFSHEKKQPRRIQSTQSLAADVLLALYTANTNDDRLVQDLQDIVHETGWYESLAAAVLTGLENALKEEKPMRQAMKDAYEKSAQVVADIFQFAKDHPVFCAFVALGILVIFAPWAIEVLGFGELGPIEGTFAAWWQSTYAGNVPAGSLFSFFQRLGMVWGLGHISSNGRLGQMKIPTKSRSGMDKGEAILGRQP